MLLKIKSFHYAFVISILTGFAGCATDQAAKVRDARPITVGIWGGAYRPNGNAGFVTDVRGMVGKQTTSFDVTGDDKENESNTTTQTATERQEIKTSRNHFDVGLHLYPSQKSAFFYGLGAQYQRRKTSFSSNTNSSTLTNPIRTDVVVDDRLALIGPSVGWDWIWQNGVSFLFDVGHRFVVSRQRSITDDGSDADVNREERDKTLATADKYNNFLQAIPSARMILGYSF